MVRENSPSIASAARKIYEEQLQGLLETDHLDEFVVIEPISGDYFLGRTLSDAIGASRLKHPDGLAHAIRVGHRAAIHFGAEFVAL